MGLDGGHVDWFLLTAGRPERPWVRLAGALMRGGRQTANGCTSRRTAETDFTSGDSTLEERRLSNSPSARQRRKASQSTPMVARSSPRSVCIKRVFGFITRVATDKLRSRATPASQVSDLAVPPRTLSSLQTAPRCSISYTRTLPETSTRESYGQ